MKKPLLLLVALLAACQSTKPEVRVLEQRSGDDAEHLVHSWLFRDCDAEGTDSLAARIRAHHKGDRGRQIESAFLHATESAPSETFLLEFGNKSQVRYREMREFLKEGPDLGFPPGLRGLLDEDGFDVYWNDVRTNLLVSYRSRAVMGLGILRSPRARSRLNELATSSGPLAATARYALADLGPQR